jgi:uncharacterized SAM-binding protein YcdF (DUF218 family)
VFSAVVAVVVCVVQASFVAWYGGIRLAVDSPVTFRLAGPVRFFDRGPSLASPGYRTIVAASVGMGAGLSGVVILQVLIAAVAATRLLTVARALGGMLAGFAAVFLYALNPDQVRWHAYVLPDSLYTSLLILTVAAIHDGWSSPTPARLLAALVWAVSAGTLNATGYLLVPIGLASCLVKWGRIRQARWIGPLTIVGAFSCVIAMLPAVRETNLIATAGQEAPDRGIVVRDFQESWLPMSADSRPLGLHQASGLAYAVDHPLETFHVGALRILSVLAHVRPYYTPRHNLALLGLLIPIYALAVVGLIGGRREPLTALLATVITAHLLVIALTHTDWDGRSLLVELPLIGALAARGLVMVRWPRWAGICVALPAVLAFVLHPTLLTSLALQFRVDNPAPSDALVLLLGGERDRPEKTAELFRNGMSSLVLIGSDADLALNRAALIEDGVPPRAIVSLGPTIGTREEAWRVREYIKAHPHVRRITVVTTAFHTLRSRWIFRRALTTTGVDVRVAASDDRRFDETNWYISPDGVQAYSQEVLKMAYSYFANSD